MIEATQRVHIMTNQQVADQIHSGWIAARTKQTRDINNGEQWLEGYDMHTAHKANVARTATKIAQLAAIIGLSLYLSGCASGGTVTAGYKAHTLKVAPHYYDRRAMQRLQNELLRQHVIYKR